MMQSHIAKLRGWRIGVTLVETMVTIGIIGIVSGMVIIQNQTTNDTERLDRAADEVVAALRYARTEAMAHCSTNSGTTQPTQPSTAYGAAFDTSANTVKVYWTSFNTVTNKWSLPGTTVSYTMYPTQTYLINFATQPEVEGVTISSVSVGGTTDTQANTSSPYVCQYLPFGEAENCATTAGSITLSYDGKTRTISIPYVGDAIKN